MNVHPHTLDVCLLNRYAYNGCVLHKKSEFGCTLIQPKCKQQMSNEKPYVLQAVKPKIDVQYIQDDNLCRSLVAVAVAALFLYYTVFCFVAKINRDVYGVREHTHTQCNLIPLSQRQRCWKLIIHVRVERIIAGTSTRERTVLFSATWLCVFVQHNMRWVFVIHKMHNNNKWDRSIALFSSAFSRKFQHSRDLFYIVPIFMGFYFEIFLFVPPLFWVNTIGRK